MGWKWRAYFGLVVLVEVGLLSGAAWARWRPAPQPPDWSVELSQRAALADPPVIPLSNDRIRREVPVDGLIQNARGGPPKPRLGDFGQPRR